MTSGNISHPLIHGPMSIAASLAVDLCLFKDGKDILELKGRIKKCMTDAGAPSQARLHFIPLLTDIRGSLGVRWRVNRENKGEIMVIDHASTDKEKLKAVAECALLFPAGRWDHHDTVTFCLSAPSEWVVVSSIH
jgi:hypothetical protein